MSELDIAIRYGLATPEKAEKMSGETSDDVSVRIFQRSEDKQWRTGILMRKAKSRGLSARHVFSATPRAVEEVEKIDDKLAKGREAGQVPFRISGSVSSVPGFLEQVGITGIELIQ
jgi:hypothetical protein